MEKCPCCKLSWCLFPPARCDELQPNNTFAPGPLVRCVDCKTVFYFPDVNTYTRYYNSVTTAYNAAQYFFDPDKEVPRQFALAKEWDNLLLGNCLSFC